MDRKESQRNLTINIKLWGIVQGVGFRPFVAKLASSMGMKGRVRNLGGLVDIILTDSEERIELFISMLKKEKPVPAEIVHIEKIQLAEIIEFDEFEILKSGGELEGAAMIPSDLAICEDCISEIYDVNDRRHRHPFNSCMICGPRYSIVDDIPYDRANTSMSDFAMCPACEKEYAEIENRRFHAQTISCHDCGPYAQLSFYEIGSNAFINNFKTNDTIEKHKDENEFAINGSIELINAGGVLALKGTGGYYFGCSALSEAACLGLREIKQREDKPFAVMFRSMEQIREYCVCDEIEEKLLTSAARPIVLLEKRKIGTFEVDSNMQMLPKPISNQVSKTSRYIGAFLPSIALQYLILDKTGPLVMTSANVSSMPMIADDVKMQSELIKIQEDTKFQTKTDIKLGLLSNKREIRTRLDDSVVRVIDGKPQMIRRSKGYAPLPLFIDVNSESDNITSREADNNPTRDADNITARKLDNITGRKLDNNSPKEVDLIADRSILATGGHLKSAFTLANGNFAYASEFLSDLETREMEVDYESRVEALKSLLKIQPNLVVCDKHPLYFTTVYAMKYVQNTNEEILYQDDPDIELYKVQHHHAHIASVMAEHDIKGKIIGFSFDGTGYGDDGKIWGSEIMLCEKGDYSRIGHLDYIKMLGGDISMKEAWKSCFSYINAFDLSKISLETKVVDSRYNIVAAAINNNINSIESSSMGRLFDAVSALIGIKQENTYEGECAIMLENAAAEALDKKLQPWDMDFKINIKPQDQSNVENADSQGNINEIVDSALRFTVSAEKVFERLIKGINENISKESMALGFHLAVARLIKRSAMLIRDESGVNQVALSGGVFQNKILMEEGLRLLRDEGFEVYYNISVPPNDGGLSLGQAYIGMQHIRSKSVIVKTK